MYDKLYLNVPYSQRNEAKSLGAHWNKTAKKWFYEGESKNFSIFGKWILSPNRDRTIIAYDNIFIIETVQKCKHCGKGTRVIGFGIGSHSILQEDNGEYFIDENIEEYDNLLDEENEIHLAWADSESDVPPFLLKYLKGHYNIKNRYSTQYRGHLSNFCDNCDSIQENYYLFNNADSPLSTETPVESELISRLSKLKIYVVDLNFALPLNWNVGYCSNDWAYEHYCNRFSNVIFEQHNEI